MRIQNICYVSRTSNIEIEDVRANVKIIDKKFNTMQSSIDTVMTKFGIMVEWMASVPSYGENPSNVDKGRSNFRRSVSPIAHSMSKEVVSKLLDFGSACEKRIVLSTSIACGSQKASSGHKKHE